ncbi:hypothetical protein P6F15_11720 [Thiopseudomonas alkaliphila]
MGSLTSKLVNEKIKGEPGRFSGSGGLYLVVPKVIVRIERRFYI